ncbi:MogA/MoaB family molybdenum cofactor biosynthesis protein [Liquorilactobacillus satsumensis]|uniref:MogA/MoaB family molybdenum cofactor biosynthesis protein n=1 Tax=Liquorilactobacillus satsumensis TaxID=259059 RepID=UPI0039E81A44
MLKAAILTISDTRTSFDDQSGQYLSQNLEAQHIKVIERRIVHDDIVEIQAGFLSLELSQPQLILTNGGTGIAQRDVTLTAISPLLCELILGFGEKFRQLSFDEVGTRALASRAMAGFNQYNQLCYCLPGSTNACRMALEKLILPEYQHLIFERQK